MKKISLKKIIEKAFVAGMMHGICSHELFKQTYLGKSEYAEKVMKELKNMEIKK